MKTVKQLYATDMTKTTKLRMRLVTIYIQSINAKTVTSNKHKRDILPRTLLKIAITIMNRMQTNKPEMTKKMYIMQKICIFGDTTITTPIQQLIYRTLDAQDT